MPKTKTIIKPFNPSDTMFKIFSIFAVILFAVSAGMHATTHIQVAKNTQTLADRGGIIGDFENAVSGIERLTLSVVSVQLKYSEDSLAAALQEKETGEWSEVKEMRLARKQAEYEQLKDNFEMLTKVCTQNRYCNAGKSG